MKKRGRDYKNTGPESIGNILGRVVGNETRETGDAVRGVFSVWDEAVGPAIAENARPKAYRNGLLIVDVKSASWAQELTFLASEIQDKVNQALGKRLVTEIRFKAGGAGRGRR